MTIKVFKYISGETKISFRVENFVDVVDHLGQIEAEYENINHVFIHKIDDVFDVDVYIKEN